MIVKLINEPNALHLVKAPFIDDLGKHPQETKFGNLAFKVRNTLVNEYSFPKSRIDGIKLEKSFKKLGDKAYAKSKKEYDFSDMFKLEQKCYQSTVRNIKNLSYANEISKEERKLVKTVIRQVFDQYGVI